MNLHQHLVDRHFIPELYNNIVLDNENEILTVYLNNLSGQFAGYQQYNPNSTDKRTNFKDEARYYTYGRANCVWGLESLNPKQNVCFVVEGIFKAAALHALGLNAIALLTSSPSNSTRNWLWAMPYTMIAIGDNDEAGKKLVRSVGRGTRFEKDIDEYSLDELRDLMEYLLWEL